MLNKINFVTILGANGNIGSLCGGLIAAFGDAEIFMVSRSLKKANEGIIKAIESVKSDVIRHNLIPKTYDDLSVCIFKSDWILEACIENIDVKHLLNQQISKFVKPKTLISTTTSSLSVSNLASDFDPDIQKYYFGTHFFNPPYKMSLCEVICGPNSDKEIQKDLIEYLEKVLFRQVIIAEDAPAFVANRIAFEIFKEALVYGQKYGIAYVDYLLGGISGRVMSPIKTIDLIGLDTYTAITKEIGFPVQDNVNKLITGKYSDLEKFSTDLISKVKEKIREGQYKEAILMLINSDSKEAKIIQYFFAKYIHISFSLLGSVAKNAADVDKAMGYGFNWLPPGALIDLIGGRVKTEKLLQKFSLPIPKEFLKYRNSDAFYSLQNTLDYRTFLRAI